VPASKLAHNHFTKRELHCSWIFFSGTSHKMTIPYVIDNLFEIEVTNVIRNLLEIEFSFLRFTSLSHLLQKINRFE